MNPQPPAQSPSKARILALAAEDYRPELVAVDEEVIARLPVRAEGLGAMKTLADQAAGWDPEQGAAYSLVFNGLNFMFWAPTPQGAAQYQWDGAHGAGGLQAALEQAWGDAPTALQLRRQLGEGSEQALVAVFGDISLARRRAQFLRELLADNRLEQAAAELVAAGRLGQLGCQHAERLAALFPMAYGQDSYLMRAQLAVMTIAGRLQERGVQLECDVTVAAGCQMPRVMRAIRVLRFSPELAARIDKHTLILRESVEERAIRAATVLGAQAMARHLGMPEHAMVNALWQKRHACGAIPHHLTVTTDY